MSDEKHPLFEALRAGERKVHEFDIRELIGLESLTEWGGKPLEKVAIRVARKIEQDAAVDMATMYAEKSAKHASGDPDVILDAKAAAIVATCFRDLRRPHVLSVWPDAEQVCRTLNADQIGALLNLYNQVRRVESPDKKEITADELAAVISMCVAAASTTIPEAVLAKIERVKLEQMFILLAIQLHEARKDEGDGNG